MTPPYFPAVAPVVPNPVLARARLVEWAMYLYLAVTAADVVATVWRLRLFDRLIAEGATSSTALGALPFSVRDETIEELSGDALDFTVTVGWVLLAAHVLLAVVYLRWQSAARFQAELRSPGWLRTGPAASVWCWFVPVWSFFGPKTVVNDLWKAGTPQEELAAGPPSPPSWLLVWWLAYLAGNVLDLVAGRGEVATVGSARNVEYLPGRVRLSGALRSAAHPPDADHLRPADPAGHRPGADGGLSHLARAGVRDVTVATPVPS